MPSKPNATTNELNSSSLSKLWRLLAPMRSLLAVLAIQILVSCLFILVFCNTFKISKWLIALRGAMGSAFRLPIWTAANYADAIEWRQKAKIKMFAADVNASRTHIEVDWRISSGIIPD